jgi:hypothetical protein
MRMAELHNAEAPASADERVEEFAEFLDRIEEDEADDIHQNETGDAPGEDDQEQAAEPGDPAIAPPIFLGQRSQGAVRAAPARPAEQGRWWQSRTLWVNLVAMLFALLGATRTLPSDIDQEMVVTAIMGMVALVNVALRLLTKHVIA